MTLTLDPRRPRVAQFHDPAVFRPVVAATALVAAVGTLVTPPDWLSVGVVLAVVALLGIPHGAVDHLVAAGLGDGARGTASRARFTRDYLLAMGGVGLVWLAAPAVALAVFIALSVHHFGQSDTARLGLGAPRQLVLQWSRGLFVVGLPLVAHVDDVAPVVERLGGGDPATWTWLTDHQVLWCAGLILQQLAAIAAFGPSIGARRALGQELVTVAALTALFLGTDPLVGFAVYFGLWHSLAHLLVLTDVLGTEPFPLRSVARLAAPVTAVSLVGLAAVAIGASLAGRPDLVLPMVFVFVSMLTAPHMVVVERLWRRRPTAPVLAPRTLRTGSASGGHR